MIVRKPFYHQVLRKATIAVGGLFSNIFITTKNSSSKTEKIVKVPIAYAGKEKYITRLQQDPSLQEDILITLPRMSFEIVGFSYDSNRQINKVHRLTGNDGERLTFNYAPVPYDVQFNVYSYTKLQDDNLQIMEQILPFFSPDLSLTIKMVESPEINQDIPFILTSVSTEDQYDGAFEDRRYIITTYSFNMKLNLYGPLLGSRDTENHFESDGENANMIKRIKIYMNNTKYHVYIDPITAGPDDDYTINEQFSEDIPREFDKDVKL